MPPNPTSPLHAAKPPSRVKALVLPLAILIGIVIASSSQTEVAHHLTSDINFTQPYLQFFLTHTTFSLIFPLHLLLLRIIHPSIPISTYLDSLRQVISTQLNTPSSTWTDISIPWILKITYLTILISIPALSWFIAMLYTTALDVTTIYATSSFHAYFFSMILLKQPLSKVTIGSIGLAFAGVLVIALAGEGGDKEGASNRALGDLVMMLGMSYTRYERLRKLMSGKARYCWDYTRSCINWHYQRVMVVYQRHLVRSIRPYQTRQKKTTMALRYLTNPHHRPPVPSLRIIPSTLPLAPQQSAYPYPLTADSTLPLHYSTLSNRNYPLLYMPTS
jgi:hypothetical protein